MTKKKTPRHRVTIRIPEELYKWVERKAEEREVSQNLVILECIKRNIDCKIIVREAKEASEKRIGRILTNRKGRESGEGTPG